MVTVRPVLAQGRVQPLHRAERAVVRRDVNGCRGGHVHTNTDAAAAIPPGQTVWMQRALLRLRVRDATRVARQLHHPEAAVGTGEPDLTGLRDVADVAPHMVEARPRR